MKNITLLLVLIVGTTLTLSAQQLPRLAPQTLPAATALHAHADGTMHSGYCGTRFDEATMADLAAFHAAREAGTLPRAGKNASAPPEIGEVQSFNVLIDDDNIGNGTWGSREFTLKDKSDGLYHLWVQTGEITNGNVTDAEVAALRVALLESTPSGSVRPATGIIQNNNDLFGQPPNYDGDGAVDILLYNIEPGNSASAQTLGFVISTDINPNAQAGQGNQADVLYLDSFQGTSDLSTLAWIAAHEYTHLIHFGNTNRNFGELLIFEAFAEYAMVYNGYFTRPMNYLNASLTYNFGLFDWNANNIIANYERGGLFATYVANKLTPEVIGGMVSSGVVNGAGFESAVSNAGGNLNDLIVGFHVTNFINNANVAGGAYVYPRPQRQFFSATPSVLIDGSGDTQTPATNRTVQGGAVQYIQWTDVADLTISLDVEAAEALRNIVRARLQPQVILEADDGSVTVEPFPLTGESQTYTGTYNSVTLAVVQVAATQQATTFVFSATWGEANPSFVFETVQFDNGELKDGLVNSVPAEAQFANAYDVPNGGTLSSVQIAAYYQGDISSSITGPRDLTLKIWDNQVVTGSDGSERNIPNNELFALQVDDPTPPTISFQFLVIDLEPYADQIGTLPEKIHVGFANAGSDDNLLYLGTANFLQLQDEVSTLYLNAFGSGGMGDWASFTDIFVNSGEGQDYFLRGSVLPIRPTFKIATGVGETSNELVGELPETILLAQNYPNPFNPSTTIAFQLPQSMDVRLAVYDILGREVAVLTDGLQTAGTHAVTFDATNFANGMYLYRLETAGQVKSRSMLLLK